MDTLENELKELKGFIADLKADKAAQKEKEKREAWTKYTSLSIVFIAVLAAIATQMAGKYSSRTLVELNNSTFNQAQASDEWSYYQANSIKQNLYEVLSDLTPDQRGGTNATQRSAAFNSKIDKYKTAKDETSAKAKALEKKRDDSRAAAAESSRRGGGMGLAVSIFQISIALGSICLVTKKKPLWYMALILAVAATGQMAMTWMR